MDKLIEHMKTCGWIDQGAEMGRTVFNNPEAAHCISHTDGMGPFLDWPSAIQACIEVASGA